MIKKELNKKIIMDLSKEDEPEIEIAENLSVSEIISILSALLGATLSYLYIKHDEKDVDKVKEKLLETIKEMGEEHRSKGDVS